MLKHIGIISLITAACIQVSYAATPVKLNHLEDTALTSFLSPGIHLKQLRQANDINGTLHTRFQETYLGYPIIGGEVISHLPKQGKSYLNGNFYKDLAKDLGVVAPKPHFEKAMQYALQALKGQSSALLNQRTDEKNELMIYVDKKTHKASWVYFIQFTVFDSQEIPQQPSFIMDVNSYHIYQYWNNIQTNTPTVGGGFGGNPKMGKLVYDGLQNNLPALNIVRYDNDDKCGLDNDDVTVLNRSLNDMILSFACEKKDPNHNNLYWSGDFDKVNDGYSPGNDALYAGRVIQDMYMKWYGIPPLKTKDGQVMRLVMRVHQRNYDNAYWDGKQMTFGDGYRMFYPLVSLGVGAHEISHGFTQQHSGLFYWEESGGLNESFSDMAAQAAEFYSVGKNSWEIGPEITKDDIALRYMEKPSKDCKGKEPGNWCSIDKMSQYTPELDVHYSSGIFNRVFFLMGTSPNWDTKKAFDVMVQANRFYWTATTTFAEAACGVLKSAKDLGYDQDVIHKALKTVEIDYSDC